MCSGKRARQTAAERQARHSLSNLSTSTAASTSTVEDPNAALDVSDAEDMDEDDAVAGASESDADVAPARPAAAVGALLPAHFSA